MKLSRFRIPAFLITVWLISNCLTVLVTSHELTFFGDRDRAHVAERNSATTTNANGTHEGYFENIGVWGLSHGFVILVQLEDGHRWEKFVDLHWPTWEWLRASLTRPIVLEWSSIGVSLVWLTLLILMAGICWRRVKSRFGTSAFMLGAGR
jgi:hypothetical protein